MLVKVAPRKALIDFLTSNVSDWNDRLQHLPSPHYLPSPEELLKDELCYVWETTPTSSPALPSMLFVPSQQLQEFLAWTSTFVETVKPFTAFCRVMDASLLRAFRDAPERPSLGRAELPCAGLIIAEAWISAQLAPSELSPFRCMATCSAALGRALAVGLGPATRTSLATRWAFARSMDGEPVMTIPSDHYTLLDLGLSVLSPHTADSDYARRVLNRSAPWLLQALSEIQTEARISQVTWETLVADVPKLRDALRRMNGTLEERFRFLADTLHIMVRRSQEPQGAFILGYLVSLLGTKTRAYESVVANLIPHVPVAILWYGLFLGLNADSLVTDTSLSRRLIRDLLEPSRLSGRPHCDIAFEELQIIGSKESVSFRRFGRELITVELLPAVTTQVILDKKKTANREPAGRDPIQPGLFEDDMGQPDEPHWLLAEISRTAERLRHLSRRLDDTLHYRLRDPKGRRERRR